MPPYLSREVFEEHAKHVEQRFDGLDSRFDRLEDLVQATHSHDEKVSWSAFLGTLLTVGMLVLAIFNIF